MVTSQCSNIEALEVFSTKANMVYKGNTVIAYHDGKWKIGQIAVAMPELDMFSVRIFESYQTFESTGEARSNLYVTVGLCNLRLLRFKVSMSDDIQLNSDEDLNGRQMSSAKQFLVNLISDIMSLPNNCRNNDKFSEQDQQNRVALDGESESRIDAKSAVVEDNTNTSANESRCSSLPLFDSNKCCHASLSNDSLVSDETVTQDFCSTSSSPKSLSRKKCFSECISTLSSETPTKEDSTVASIYGSYVPKKLRISKRYRTLTEGSDSLTKSFFTNESPIKHEIPSSSSSSSSSCYNQSFHSINTSSASINAFHKNLSSQSLSNHLPLLSSSPSNFSFSSHLHLPLNYSNLTNSSLSNSLFPFFLPSTSMVPSSSSPFSSGCCIKKGRSEVKKCRKVYGIEKKSQWCNQCRWKKACSRFPDLLSSKK